MMQYFKKEDDLKFRRVNPANLQEEDNFTEFPSEGYVEYHDALVLEVLCRDGTTHIEYGGEKQSECVEVDGNCLFFSKDLPKARLWLQDISSGMRYKVPMSLPEKGGYSYVRVPGGPSNVQLCGDPYFEKVYELKRK